MTPEERIIMDAALMRIETTLAMMALAVTHAAERAKRAEAMGLATAAYLLRESIDVYAEECRRYCERS